MAVNERDDLIKCNTFAVYGTLMGGFHNNILMEEARFIDRGESEFWATMYSAGGFPILSTAEPTSKIVVELYTLPLTLEGEKALERIDGLEGHPDWYKRVIKTFNINGEKIRAWIYVQDNVNRDAPVVESGDWREYKLGVKA